jgi:hypothetical protein
MTLVRVPPYPVALVVRVRGIVYRHLKYRNAVSLAIPIRPETAANSK